MCSHFYTFCLSFIVNEMPSKHSWNNQLIFVLSRQFVMLPPAKAVMPRVNIPGALLWKRFSTREGCIKYPERTKKKPTKLTDHKIKVPHLRLAGTSSLFLCWWPLLLFLFFGCYVQLFCDPMDCSPPGSSVHGISQARILELGCHFFLQGIFLTQGLNPQWKPPAVEAQSHNHWTTREVHVNIIIEHKGHETVWSAQLRHQTHQVWKAGTWKNLRKKLWEVWKSKRKTKMEREEKMGPRTMPMIINSDRACSC